MHLVDTARVYNVEEQVGRGIKKSDVPRKDILSAQSCGAMITILIMWKGLLMTL